MLHRCNAETRIPCRTPGSGPGMPHGVNIHDIDVFPWRFIFLPASLVEQSCVGFIENKTHSAQ